MKDQVCVTDTSLKHCTLLEGLFTSAVCAACQEKPSSASDTSAAEMEGGVGALLQIPQQQT